MLLFLKILGILISSFFGVYALLHDYKDELGKVTYQGRFAMIGIVLGAAIGAISTALEAIEADDQLEQQLTLMEEQIRTAQTSLQRIDRIANRFLVEEVTLRMDLASEDLGSAISELVAELDDREETSSACRSMDENELLGADFGIYFSLPVHTSDSMCQSIFESSFFGEGLPEFFVTVRSGPDDPEDASMRIVATNRLPMNQNTDLRMRYYENAGVVDFELDDVPVRFRTESILAIEDFANKELFIGFSDLGFVAQLFDVRLRVQELDIDLEDGRDITLQMDQPRGEYPGAWWIAEYVFAAEAGEVLASFPREIFDPSDSDE